MSDGSSKPFHGCVEYVGAYLLENSRRILVMVNLAALQDVELRIVSHLAALAVQSHILIVRGNEGVESSIVCRPLTFRCAKNVSSSLLTSSNVQMSQECQRVLQLLKG
jgi:hypothetical protein